MADALDALGINLGYLITHIINLLLMMVLLYLVAYKPIVKMLSLRRERIAESLANARRAEEALASAETDRQAILDEAHSEAQRLTNEARSRADELTKQLLAEARSDAARIKEHAEAEGKAEKDMALASMRDQIIELSIAAANHLIATEMDGKKQKEIVKEFFTSLPEEAKGLGGALEVVTAVPLTQAEQKMFAAELGTDDIQFITQPGILGGVIVRGEGQQVDGSFFNQLAEMRDSLS